MSKTLEIQVPPSPTRLSLQPPSGLPSIPRTPSISSLRATSPLRKTFSPPPSALQEAFSPQTHKEQDEEGEEEGQVDTDTLISCLTDFHLRPDGDDESGPVKTRFPRLAPPPASSPLGTREEQRRIYLGPKLSDRATGGPDAGPLIERFSCLFKDQYNCKSNPKGIVSMGVAENYLMEKECLEMFSQALAKNFLSSDLSYGDNLWGSRRINRALSEFYNGYFNPAVPVLPEHIICGNGCSAVLDQLFYTLVDEGEAVLLAAPYYTGFDRDLIGRARIRLVPVPVGCSSEACNPHSLQEFHKKIEELSAQGIRTRAVIVCNPQNPLGKTYPRETLLEYAKFCEERDLHLVSDEIYGMSVYDNPDYPDAAPFTSMLSLDVEKELGIEFDRARLHVVYGMSKDFCANGLRVGSLVSQHNPLLLRAMANTSMLMKISSPADVIWSSLLTDKPRLDAFLMENKKRLGEAHGFVKKWFEARGVRVANCNAGHFIWVNLGEKLGFSDAVTEKQVFQRLLDGGVYIAPGSAYHNPIAGWYRVTFSIARDNLLVGLGKMERILGLTAVVNGSA